jgi:pilus assembly protein CpaB
MNTKWMPIVIALTVAIIAGFVALKLVGSKSAPPPQPVVQQQVQQQPVIQEVKTERVYVARKSIPVGTVIDASMIDTQPWPQHLLLSQFIVVGDDALVEGRVARSAFQSREPFIKDKLANPNDPSLIAAALDEGMRLVTISVDAVSGLSGFVAPGDRVDVLLTREIEKESGGESADRSYRAVAREKLTQTLASNIKVLAVDQRAGAEGSGRISIPSTVSLEVSPEEAHRVALGAEAGVLSLLLRGLDGSSVVEGVLVARESGLLSEGGGVSSSGGKRKEGSGVVVIRGVKPFSEEQ